MARIRTIKPEFWLDEDLASCNESTRLMAIGLLNQADDEGFFKAHTALLKAGIFPFTEPSVSIHDMLIQLSKIDYLRVFTANDGKEYGEILGFTKHQRVNRPSPSKIKLLERLTEDSVNTHGGLTPGKERKGRERKGINPSDADRTQTPKVAPKPKKPEPTPPLPDWIDKNTWDDFLAIRKKLKATDSNRALSILINQLAEFRSQGQNPNTILEQSISNSWKGVFGLKQQTRTRADTRAEITRSVMDIHDTSWMDPPPSDGSERPVGGTDW